jgi:hypothetical protein
MYSVDGASGVLDPQPMVGKFVNGRGEFFDQEDYQGQSIFVRWVWTASPDSPRWEQAFSVDGGRTWETNRIVTYTRVDRASPTGAPEPLPLPVGAEEAGPRGFDFEIGSWNIHLKRRLHPLTGSTTWVDFDGTSVTRKAWNNRAEIEEFETQNSSGHVVGLTLRLFNPQTHQWRLYWANSDDGRMVEPQIGEIKNGVGEFYAQDIFHDKAILVRFVWTKMNSAVPHFEQAFSDDGGKTWEVNWITDQTRSPAKVAAGE